VAIVIGAGVAAAGAVGSSVISSSAAGSAANTQAGAANNATAAQLGMFNTVQSNLQPYNAAGQNSLGALQSFINGQGNTAPFSFNYNPASDPEYNFLLNQGTQAITSQASATGGVNSGATLEALQNYGQNTALQSYQTEFGNALNTYDANQTNTSNIFARLLGIAGLGENAAAGVGNAAVSTGQSIGSNMIGAGNAQAAGQVGSANALSGGLTSLSSLFNNSSFLNSFSNGGGASSAFTLGSGTAVPTGGTA
jgi:hypothetical protein